MPTLNDIFTDDLARMFADWETIPCLNAPRVYRNETLYEFPRPVPSVRVQDAWDFQALKVPLAAGDMLVGHSRQGVNLVIEGQYQPAADTTEADRFTALDTLRAAVHVGAADEKYELFLHYDEDAEEYRKFKNCSTVRFECELADSHRFAYRVVIHAEDPELYTTGPGA